MKKERMFPEALNKIALSAGGKVFMQEICMVDLKTIFNNISITEVDCRNSVACNIRETTLKHTCNTKLTFLNTINTFSCHFIKLSIDTCPEFNHMRTMQKINGKERITMRKLHPEQNVRTIMFQTIKVN